MAINVIITVIVTICDFYASKFDCYCHQTFLPFFVCHDMPSLASLSVRSFRYVFKFAIKLTHSVVAVVVLCFCFYSRPFVISTYFIVLFFHSFFSASHMFEIFCRLMRRR